MLRSYNFKKLQKTAKSSTVWNGLGLKNERTFGNVSETPSRIIPKYVNDDMVKLSKDMTDVYDPTKEEEWKSINILQVINHG